MMEAQRVAQEVDTRLITLTPDSLREDNRKNSEKGILKFLENKAKGLLRLVEACGDSRGLIPEPERTVTKRSIATAGSKEARIAQSSGIGQGIVLGHGDGATIEIGKRLRGCGGLGAKEDLIQITEEVVRGIDYYIRRRIRHPDVVVQSLISAEEIAAQSGKPVLATVQDHRTATIYPIAAFLDGGVIQIKKIRNSDLIIYNEAGIYKDGIPVLDDAQVPDQFRDFMEASRAQVKDLLIRFPNIRDLQRVQNPRMVVLSTELMSMRLRYPQTADVPGILFKLHVPREKIGTGVSIKPELLEESLEQAQYPLEHAVKNFGTDNSFSKTNRVLIETEDFNVSVQLAQSLSEREWMQKWLALPDHKIIVAQSQEGITNNIDWFPLAA